MRIFTASTELDPLTGTSRNVERCPKCLITNQNFLIIPSEEIPLLGCFRCGTVFVSKRFISGLDVRALLEEQKRVEKAAAEPEPEPKTYICSSCQKDCRTGSGLAAHLKVCEAFGG